MSNTCKRKIQTSSGDSWFSQRVRPGLVTSTDGVDSGSFSSSVSLSRADLSLSRAGDLSNRCCCPSPWSRVSSTPPALTTSWSSSILGFQVRNKLLPADREDSPISFGAACEFTCIHATSSRIFRICRAWTVQSRKHATTVSKRAASSNARLSLYAIHCIALLSCLPIVLGMSATNVRERRTCTQCFAARATRSLRCKRR